MRSEFARGMAAYSPEESRADFVLLPSCDCHGLCAGRDHDKRLLLSQRETLLRKIYLSLASSKRSVVILSSCRSCLSFPALRLR